MVNNTRSKHVAGEKKKSGRENFPNYVVINARYNILQVTDRNKMFKAFKLPFLLEWRNVR